jgi:hypothetical protein
LVYTIVGVVDNECNRSSEQTLDYTIVGVVDYECNSSSEQTKDYKIVGVVDYECNNYTNNCIVFGLFWRTITHNQLHQQLYSLWFVLMNYLTDNQLHQQ